MEKLSHSPEELKRMQEIAIKYMREIHKQSNNIEEKNQKNKKEPQKKHIFKYHQSKKTAKNILQNIFKEPDKALIIMLIVLLMESEENTNLVLILMYLLM